MWQLRKSIVCFSALVLILSACASTGQPDPEETVRTEFRRSLAQRQVARRHQTAKLCLRRGVVLPDGYQQKGGGMLEEYVPGHAPCGIPAEERAERAEADFRETWEVVLRKPIPLGYEWLLEVKRRLASWVDAGVLKPEQARTTLREAQWLLVERQESLASASSPQASAELFAELNSALNRAIAEQGITCQKNGEKLPC
ncbi:MAG: hypothetical protein ACE5K9_05960 [Candidatus Methylomirabilales bacterium]